jgi:phosphoglycolate phosphatase-like HAD superfamily hydrolase
MSTPAPRPYAAVDVDGVLADVRHRLAHLAGRRKDWDAFFAAAPDDPPLPEGLAVAARLAADHEVVYLTGRPEGCRRDTLAWLQRHGLPEGRLVMRREGDRRPARLTKVALLRRLATERPVAVLVDDDAQVCTAARAAGFSVLRADWMPTDPASDNTLTEAQERHGRT